MTVEYRIIPGYPDYRIGTDASVWSKKKTSPRHPDNVWKILTPVVVGKGYQRVSLRNEDGKKPFLVHNLMLEIFVGPKPHPGMWGLHWDDDPSNNSLENLRWGTRKENAKDAIRNDRTVRGERHGRSKLKEADIFRVRELYKQGLTQRKVAETLGVTQGQVWRILNCANWAHIEN